MAATLEFIKGMTWGWPGIRGTWKTPEAEASLREMVDRLGVNWTAVAFSALQDHPQATEIRFEEPPTVTDEEVVWAVETAHALGLKVCLKPVVNCKNGTWRAHICFFDHDVPGEPTWGQWFASYERFILHYARIAEATGCEMFCVGCEMVQADKREREWRALIAKVRAVYTGLVTYNCDKYQEERVRWWDAVDVISASGYYAPERWDERIAAIEQVVAREQKPFFFMETGCPSRKGSLRYPNDWTHQGPPSMEEQDRFYRAMFAKLDGKPWFHGYMLWDWPARLYPREQAPRDDGYCIYGKTAEATVRAYYQSRP
ncbi:hypothetical protein GCM10010885_22350 [Alicyclobacillus cellulosilyticus]|uniref:1,4-beta-xylanase n=1 Tax=Alicyclobacillus cellulosilyticus TaxID=1003997 RepID=A0A917KIC1_9BACL|nr:1,4-beta-xylanase [Alicyclobacillus cellulosilyticus]GGJ12478.1 hypothetical protein GCM10010885_22350 [Alicyclobacillus cellulosilyticus]